MKLCNVCDNNGLVFCEKCGFAKSLRKIRKEKGLTQAKLARLSGMELTAVSQFETASRSPHLKNIIRLCYALKCNPNDLINIG